MIIIADSGSSKIDWRLITSDGEITQSQCAGFNPYYQPKADLRKNISEIIVPLANETVKKIFFYGTGVSSEGNVKIIQDTFNEFFTQAKVTVEWDLLAAARATCGDEEGLVCILGTGSNTCKYDGKDIVEQVANLGWILADEGSGTSIGKKFLFDYLRKLMPEKLANMFHEQYPFTREEFLEKIYTQENPNKFLASFSKFIHKNLNDPYCHNLIYNCFSEFIENNIMLYRGYKKLKVHSIGSIGFHFSNILRQVADAKGIMLKNNLEAPIAALSLYHKKDLE